MLLAQADAPEPLLSDESGPIWSNILLLLVVLMVVAVVAWRVWRYVRGTRHLVDEALDAVTELRSKSVERSS